MRGGERGMTIHACRTVLLEAQGAVKLKKNNRLMCSEIDYNNGVSIQINGQSELVAE